MQRNGLKKGVTHAHNWMSSRNAIHQFMQKYMYDHAQQKWWDEICAKLKSRYQDVWRVINKVLKGTTAAPVQPLKKNDGEYDFDDETIANRLQQVHVSRHQNSNNNLDNWTKEVNEHVKRGILVEKQKLNQTMNTLEGYNQDIKIQEIRAAIISVKADSSPGPDKIHPQMIITGFARNLEIMESHGI